MIDNPCKDCPHRHEACAVDCPQWAEYEKKRNQLYDIRQSEKLKRYRTTYPYNKSGKIHKLPTNNNH